MRKTRMTFSGAKNSRGRGRNNSRSSKFGQASFDPAMFVKKAELSKPKASYVHQHNFNDFEIDTRLKQNIANKGYITPTPIQDQSIPHLLKGRDMVGVANTGTGKTAAFLVPLINKVIRNHQERVLIVTPTRELALQVQEELVLFTNGLRIFSALCIGGAPLDRQIKNLRRRPSFVIGTPGRLKDLDQRKVLNFNDYSSFVLDEVDRMLDMGFINDVQQIVSRLPQKRHSLFFSATVGDKVRRIMGAFLNNPVSVVIKAERFSENVDQDVVRTKGRPKVDVLHDLLIKDGFDKVLVFGRTKFGMEKLAKELDNRGFNVASIHGNKSQGQRQTALKRFRDNKVQALLATDVVSRGLDIDNVTHVINFDLPQTYEDYIHRIGRTGRADKTGSALTFLD